jgi:uracil-DNA glycosylase
MSYFWQLIFAMSSISPQIEKSWLNVLQDEFQKPYFADLKQFLLDEINTKKVICPPPKQMFSAFEACPFEKVKVVIIGQDPYHGPRQAHGLCFSVNKEIPIPPSLKNIYKELHADMGCDIPNHGNLEKWAKQGVLLLNAVLSVRSGAAASHAKKGWEQFTDRVITEISEKKEGVVFLLWGRYAQQKGAMIDKEKHFVLEAAHPSPLSAHNGFFGCKHFSMTNEILKSQGKKKIDWQID